MAKWHKSQWKIVTTECIFLYLWNDLTLQHIKLNHHENFLFFLKNATGYLQITMLWMELMKWMIYIYPNLVNFVIQSLWQLNFVSLKVSYKNFFKNLYKNFEIKSPINHFTHLYSSEKKMHLYVIWYSIENPFYFCFLLFVNY